MSIYLDNAATAKYRSVDDIVINTMTDAMERYWRNPSSLYASDVKKEIDNCRKNIADFIGANADEIYFTSGASESNNWAIRGWFDAMQRVIAEQEEYDENYFCHAPYIFTTPIEHKSILNLIKSDVYLGHTYMFDVDEYGKVVLESLENNWLKLYKNEYILVSINAANNEIGTIQNIRDVANLVHKYYGVLHVDATQMFGHIPISVGELGVDMMSVSGHKISPVLRGIGFLYKKNGVHLDPLIYGSQENGLRGGTENTYGIIGLSKALEFCDISSEHIEEVCAKRDYFIDLLVSKFGCKLNGSRENRLSNNINVTFPQNITSEALLYTLDLSDIHVSVGSACNSKEIKPSHVLKAIGLSDEQAMKTVRFSLPDDITYEEIDYVVEEIDKAIKVIEI